jgi:hypothetical protein
VLKFKAISEILTEYSRPTILQPDIIGKSKLIDDEYLEIEKLSIHQSPKKNLFYRNNP